MRISITLGLSSLIVLALACGGAVVDEGSGGNPGSGTGGTGGLGLIAFGGSEPISGGGPTCAASECAESSDGSSSCTTVCTDHTYVVDCAPTPSVGIECSCKLDGTSIATCPKGNQAADYTGCCHMKFFPVL